MKMEFKKRNLILTLLVISAWEVSSRATSEQDKQAEEDPEGQVIQLHVITKREVRNDIQQDYPHVEGRTFPASEPLDPNNPSALSDAPQDLFQGGFDTHSEVFQPEVDARSSDEDGPAASSATGQQTGSNEGNETAETTGTTYGAQYPYTQSSASEEYRGSVPQAGTHGYQTSDGVEQTVSSRRVVLAGGGSGTSGNGQYGTQTSRSYAEYQPSETSRTGYTSQTGGGGSSYSGQYGSRYPDTSRQVSTERRVYTGSGSNSQYPRYNSGGTITTNTYQGSATEVRGPRYDGPRYIDNNGHYVDAQGRHLDSTGRYYDISGRYADATMTRMQTYQHIASGTGGGSGTSSGTNYNTGTRTNTGNYGTSRRYTSGTSPSSGYYDSNGRYISHSSSQSGSFDRSQGSGSQGGGSYVDTSRSRPVDSYGGTQFYSGGNSYQTTYDPIVSQISSDPNCPVMNNRVTINGLSCNNAVAQLGPFVCYNYERVSTECCQRCLQVKRSEYVGCEYGDRSNQCRDIQPSDCYNERNRQICCDRCRQFREQRAQSSTAGCEYGDLTPRCQSMVQNPHLCYMPENQRVCCHSCPRLANREEPDCQWGNQSPDVCRPFGSDGRLQLNCYLQAVQEICCSTCRSLRERMRDSVPGCEYGDSPVLFYSGRDALDCPAYISQYGLDNCDDPEVSRKCCYTCYRYRRARG